jgi:hypothetical protein
MVQPDSLNVGREGFPWMKDTIKSLLQRRIRSQMAHGSLWCRHTTFVDIGNTALASSRRGW